MRNDELRTLEFGQEGLEPLRGVDVQVVGRLVEEDDVDAVEPDELTGKRKLGLFATGEFVHGHVHGVLGETQALKNAFCDAGHVAPTARGESLLQLGVALHHRFPVALVKRRVNHLRFDGSNFFFELLKLATFATQLVLNARIRLEIANLREVGEANAGCELDVPRVLLLLADGVEKGRFSGAVVTDNADAVAVVDLDVDVLQHVHGTKGAVHRFHVDEFASHVGPSIPPRG